MKLPDPQKVQALRETMSTETRKLRRDRENTRPVEEQCGVELEKCQCGHRGHDHRYGSCSSCDCARFDARRCKGRKGRCSWHGPAPLTLSMQPTRQYLDRIESEDRRASARIDPTQCGIYFLECEGFIKIGKTINLRTRMHDIQCANPFNIRLLGFHRCDWVLLDGLEDRYHARFADLHHRGEWFRSEPRLLMALDALRRMQQ